MKLYIAKDKKGSIHLFRTVPTLVTFQNGNKVWCGGLLNNSSCIVHADFPELKPCQCAIFESKEIVDEGYNPVKNEEL